MTTCATCINTRPDADQIRRARALTCHWCIYADHDGGFWQGTAVACTVSGLPIERHIASCGPTCPKGKHRADGMVRWLGILWFGCPAPWRWFFKFSGPIPGCGCMAWAKLLWIRIRHKLAITNKGTSHGNIQPQH